MALYCGRNRLPKDISSPAVSHANTGFGQYRHAVMREASAHLLAEEIFNEAAGQEQQDEQIRNLQNQKNLNHLFSYISQINP